MKTRALPLVLLTLLAACSETPTPLAPGAPALAKPSGGGSGTDTDSRAVLEFYATLSSGAAAGITSDGAPYEGGVCGVHAKIFWYDADYSQSGDLVFDPDQNKPGSCQARKLLFDLDGNPDTAPTALGPFTNVRQIMQVVDTRTQVMQWDVGLSGCERLRFGTPGSDNLTATSGGVVVTRLAGEPSPSKTTAPTTPGQWRVETVDGKAQCLVWSKGKYVVNPDQSYVLPYSFVATEKPFGT